jgi:hypothetical protein
LKIDLCGELSQGAERAGVQNALLQTLLDRGANLEQPSIAGNRQSIVIGCLANGRPKAAEFLASRGAHLDLTGAAALGRLDVVKSFFDEDGRLKPNAAKERLTEGFLFACGYARNDVVEFLLGRAWIWQRRAATDKPDCIGP